MREMKANKFLNVKYRNPRQLYKNCLVLDNPCKHGKTEHKHMSI